MTQPIKVSIITAVYNGEAHIERAIRSVIKQSFKNIEYIIIDGGSTDNTLFIIGKYAGHISHLISEKDEGIADAFNKGIAIASGDLIGIVNADDWLAEDGVEKIVQGIGDFDLAFGDLQYWKNGEGDYISRANLDKLDREMTINHPTVFVRAACYKKFGSFDPAYVCAMDYELMVRLLINGCRFMYLPVVISNMRWGGLSDKKWLLGCRETLKVKNRYFPEKVIQHRLYFIRHVAAIRITKLLQTIGFGGQVRRYRKWKYKPGS